MKLHEGIQKTASGNEYVYTVYDGDTAVIAWHSVRKLESPIYVTKSPYTRFTRKPEGKEYETLTLETVGAIASGTDEQWLDRNTKTDYRGIIEF